MTEPNDRSESHPGLSRLDAFSLGRYVAVVFGPLGDVFATRSR